MPGPIDRTRPITAAAGTPGPVAPELKTISFPAGLHQPPVVKPGDTLRFEFPRQEIEKHVKGAKSANQLVWIGVLHYEINGAPGSTKFAGPHANTRGGGYDGHTLAPAELKLPADARDVKVWVELRGREGVSWYSNNGSNFAIPVDRKDGPHSPQSNSAAGYDAVNPPSDPGRKGGAGLIGVG